MGYPPVNNRTGTVCRGPQPHWLLTALARFAVGSENPDSIDGSSTEKKVDYEARDQATSTRDTCLCPEVQRGQHGEVLLSMGGISEGTAY